MSKRWVFKEYPIRFSYFLVKEIAKYIVLHIHQSVGCRAKREERNLKIQDRSMPIIVVVYDRDRQPTRDEELRWAQISKM